MQRSVEAGELVTLDRCDTIIDGLRVKRVGEHTFDLVSRFVDEVVAVPDDVIFENVLWIMERCKLVVEGARRAGRRAAPPGRDARRRRRRSVAALRTGYVGAEPGTKVVCVLSGGNLDVSQLRGLRWN